MKIAEIEIRLLLVRIMEPLLGNELRRQEILLNVCFGLAAMALDLDAPSLLIIHCHCCFGSSMTGKSLQCLRKNLDESLMEGMLNVWLSCRATASPNRPMGP